MPSASRSIRSAYHEFILSNPAQAKRVRTLVEHGRALLESGQNDAARRLFLQALSVYPCVIPALNNLALIALHEGDPSRALDITERVLECDPKDPIAHSLAVQGWYNRESEPLLRLHVQACLAGYIDLLHNGDAVDPEYAERCFPFVFQALLIAQENAGIIQLYESVPRREWRPIELTWVGIAYFNEGRMNDAQIVWRRANRIARYEPARIYATMAQRVLSGELLPFTLDYDLILPDDDEYLGYAASSLTLASMVNKVFRLGSRRAQETLVRLIELDMPGQDFFLRRLVQNERLAPGIRMTAAIHLLWLIDHEPLASELVSGYSAEELKPEDLPAFYLLQATLAQISDGRHSLLGASLLEKAYMAAHRGKIEWVIDYIEEMDELPDTFFDTFGAPESLVADDDNGPEEGGDSDVVIRSLFPRPVEQADSLTKSDGTAPKRRRGSKETKNHRHKS